MYDKVKLTCVRVTIVAIGKAIRITYSECVFVDLGMQHAMRLQLIFICGLPVFIISFYFTS